MNSPSNFEQDEEFWERWHSNTYERELVKPMTKPLSAPLNLAISDSDLEKLKAGFRPRSQDDKYAWLIEHGDGNGDVFIHVIRHFVHEEMYVLHVVPGSSGDSGVGAEIRSITWEGDGNGVQNDLEQAKRNVVVLARVILKCEFEMFPSYALGTGQYREIDHLANSEE